MSVFIHSFKPYKVKRSREGEIKAKLSTLCSPEKKNTLDLSRQYMYVFQIKTEQYK